jgi:hypothetical protein
MTRPENIASVYVITVHDDANYSAHIQELQKVINIENARVSNGDSETTVFSNVDFEIFVEAGIPRYSGTFSKPVLRWIRTRQEVKGVQQER